MGALVSRAAPGGLLVNVQRGAGQVWTGTKGESTISRADAVVGGKVA